MCNYCIRTEDIEALETRHKVWWCVSCFRYISRLELRCPNCSVAEDALPGRSKRVKLAYGQRNKELPLLVFLGGGTTFE
jgi:hypothetical protein